MPALRCPTRRRPARRRRGSRAGLPTALSAAARLALVLAVVVALAASLTAAAGSRALARGERTGARPAGGFAAGTVDEPVGGAQLGGAGFVVDLPAGVPAPPELPAGGYVLADAASGQVLLAKAPHAKGLPASTMKVLTALALLPRMSPGTLVRAMPEDAAVEGTKVGLDPGAAYTVDQLFESLLLASANDSAVAIARSFGGLGQATEAMNETARVLGAQDTLARNTSGLDAPRQVTSAYDLALIGRAALRDADIAAYVAERTVRFPGGRPTKGGQRREAWQVSNHNKLMWNYPGAIGVKNGYTTRARHTYIGAARRGQATYLLTFLNGTTADWRLTAAMFDWAFAHGTRVRPVGQLIEPRTAGAAGAVASAEAADTADHPADPVGASTTGGDDAVVAERQWHGDAAVIAVLVVAGLVLLVAAGAGFAWLRRP